MSGHRNFKELRDRLAIERVAEARQELETKHTAELAHLDGPRYLWPLFDPARRLRRTGDDTDAEV